MYVARKSNTILLVKAEISPFRQNSQVMLVTPQGSSETHNHLRNKKFKIYRHWKLEEAN